MVADGIARQGDWLFRWRSYVLLALIPVFVIAIDKPEAVEMTFGQTADTIYEGLCIAMAFLGLGLRAATVGFVPAGTSGRNTRGQIADTLNTTGLYSLTRNPLYFANAIIYMSIALFTQDILVAVVMGLFLFVYLERIIATEEVFLTRKFGDAYLAWARDVPAFFPRLSGWVAPAMTFSVRSVLRREYSGLFAIVVTFFALDQTREFLNEHPHGIDTTWLLALAAGTVAYVGLRFAKKHTTLLQADGR